MLKQIVILLILALIAVNASIRIKRQFGPDGAYQHRGGPSYRPSFGGNGYGLRAREDIHRGGYGIGGRRGNNKVVITEFIHGK